MGTTPNGPRPSNDITISRSSTPKLVDPATGKSTIAGAEVPLEPKAPERSFAQPSPVVPPKVVNPKAHGSDDDEKDALKRNSLKKNDE